MNPEPLVHIVIINYQQWQFTINCVDSVLQSHYTNFKVWIVEVGDLDDSFSRISKHIKSIPSNQIEIVRLEGNPGFAGANNSVLKKLLSQKQSEYIFLLNNDTLIHADSLGQLVDAYGQLVNQGNKPGIIGPIIMEGHQTDIIQSAGGIFNPAKGYIKFIGGGERDHGQYDDMPRKVDYVMGAAMFLSNEVLRKIGLMDERYFLYCEDVDWCVTARQLGFRNYVVSQARVFHFQGASTGTKYQQDQQNITVVSAYLYSSYLKLYKKFYRKNLPTAYFQLIRQMLSALSRGQFSRSMLILKVVINGFNRA